MEIIGLTGGIACGKSAVAAWMTVRGVRVVDADEIAREVTAAGTEGLELVVAAFGREVLGPDGGLDRKYLGTRVFKDPSARMTLNQIVHPRIAAASAARLAVLSDEGRGFALYEAALLVENGAYKMFGGLVVVTAPPEVQLARLMARDGAGQDDARARISAQCSLSTKVAAGTWVIDNGGTRARLEARVAGLYAELLLAYGSPRPHPVRMGRT